MAKTDVIEMEGIVVDALKGAKFIVELENKHQVNCTLCGRLRSNNIRVLKGDKVTVEISPYDLNNGRISWRFKE